MQIHRATESQIPTLTMAAAVEDFLAWKVQFDPICSARVSVYRRAARLWNLYEKTKKIVAPGDNRKSSQVATSQQLREFGLFLKNHAAKSGYTAGGRDHFTCILAVVRWAAGQANQPPPDGPSVKFRRPVARKTFIPMEHVNAIYRACKVATWPRRDRDRRAGAISPTQKWQAIIVLLFNYGADFQDFARWQSRHEPFAWKDVSTNAECPCPDTPVENKYGWLAIDRNKTKREQLAPVYLPMNAAVLTHLERIRPAYAKPADPVFNWPLSYEHVRDQWNRILDAASVEPKPLADGTRRRYLLKHWRKTAATHHEMHRAGSAAVVLGHSRSKGEVMTLRHYANTGAALVDAMKLPQPEEFNRAGT